MDEKFGCDRQRGTAWWTVFDDVGMGFSLYMLPAVYSTYGWMPELWFARSDETLPVGIPKNWYIV